MKQNFKIGDHVRHIKEKSEYSGINKCWHPPIGTIGEIVDIDDEDSDLFVQWPKGTTYGDDRWYVEKENVELV